MPKRNPKEKKPFSEKKEKDKKTGWCSDRRMDATAMPASIGMNVHPAICPDLRIRHTELLGGVVRESDGFDVVINRAIQPGNFHWLGPIAQRFETYVVHSLEFTFVTLGRTTDAGGVGLFWEPDVRDAAPVSITDFMSNRYSCFGSLWRNLNIKVKDVADLNPNGRHYVRNVMPVTLSRFSDCGRVMVCTEGAVDTPKTKGHLYITYDITFSTPQVQGDEGGHVDVSTFVPDGAYTYLGNTQSTGVTSVVKALPTPAQVARGATEGVNLFNVLPSDTNQLVTFKVKGTGLTDRLRFEHGVGLQSNMPDSIIDSTLSTNLGTIIFKHLGQSADTSWFQPRMFNGTFTSLSDAIMRFSYGDYNNLA